MKKIMLLMGAIGFLLVACNKDENSDPIQGENPELFNELSPEQNKLAIENAGIEMVNTMEDMKDLDAIEVCINLVEVLDAADPTAFKPSKKSKLAYTAEAIAGIADDDFEFNNFFNDLKYGIDIDDPESAQDLWEQIVGTYTWNEGQQVWDYTPNSSEVVMLFPAMDNSTTNDGKVRIYGYEGVFMGNPLDEEYTGDLPTDIALEISINNTVVITYIFGADYNSEGIPSKLATNLSIPPFKWEVDVTNTDTDVAMNYKFTNGNTTIMEAGGGAKGLFTQDNIDDSWITVTETWGYWDYQYNPNTGGIDEVWVEYVDE